MNVGKVAIVEPEHNIKNVENKSLFGEVGAHSKPLVLKFVGSTLAKRLRGIENKVDKQSIIIIMMSNVLVVI